MRVAALVLAVLIAIPTAVSGWGFEAHTFIADRLIDLLPPELKPLFEKRRAYVIERSIHWRGRHHHRRVGAGGEARGACGVAANPAANSTS